MTAAGSAAHELAVPLRGRGWAVAASLSSLCVMALCALLVAAGAQVSKPCSLSLIRSMRQQCGRGRAWAFIRASLLACTCTRTRTVKHVHRVPSKARPSSSACSARLMQKSCLTLAHVCCGQSDSKGVRRPTELEFQAHALVTPAEMRALARPEHRYAKLLQQTARLGALLADESRAPPEGRIPGQSILVGSAAAGARSSALPLVPGNR